MGKVKKKKGKKGFEAVEFIQWLIWTIIILGVPTALIYYWFSKTDIPTWVQEGIIAVIIAMWLGWSVKGIFPKYEAD
ncbi:MAG: hypothetical protein GF353_28590 [Candidatus Lokiarchaeota archaeon]|nr:hypothetical protein [Candidatus Lokiarchaeota archaeon]MBD3353961.1 hypothetical protein [Candidatus Lokiarchaeota archaeon]